jgi:hypothetical protein
MIDVPLFWLGDIYFLNYIYSPFFSSVAHVWVPGAKRFFFLNLIFMSVRILSLNAIHSVIKKMFHEGPVAAAAVRNGIFYFWIFFNETWHIYR